MYMYSNSQSCMMPSKINFIYLKDCIIIITKNGYMKKKNTRYFEKHSTAQDTIQLHSLER